VVEDLRPNRVYLPPLLEEPNVLSGSCCETDPAGSRCAQFPQYLFGIDETTGFEIFLRGSQCPVKGSAVSRVEPVARIEEQEINFGSLRELCRLVHQKPTLVNTGL
jgi:hypothetical protein